MADASQIREHMTVVGSDGQQVGTVDHLEAGNRIKLAKSDPAAQGQHHYIPLDWVDRIDGQQVRLSRSSEEVMREWQAATA